MAQQQLEQQQLEFWNMWHSSEASGPCLEQILISVGSSRQLKQQRTIYLWFDSEWGQCTTSGCPYKTSSKHKLFDHVMMHFIIYAIDCNYLTSRRDSTVNHLRHCHNRRGSITQTDNDDSWDRLKESHPGTSPAPTPFQSGQLNLPQYMQIWTFRFSSNYTCTSCSLFQRHTSQKGYWILPSICPNPSSTNAIYYNFFHRYHQPGHI